MTTTENPAREEYYETLKKLFVCRAEITPNVKDKILGITYDPHVALQKRVEELEAALKAFLSAQNSNNNERRSRLVSAAVQAQNILNK